MKSYSARACNVLLDLGGDDVADEARGEVCGDKCVGEVVTLLGCLTSGGESGRAAVQCQRVTRKYNAFASTYARNVVAV